MSGTHRIRTALAAGLLLPCAAAPVAAQSDASSDSLLSALTFRNLGPSVGGGRVSAVEGVPGKPNLYYVGAAAGGVWKTTDGGNSWTAIFKDQPAASIGAVALAPSNPNVVWVGTGEGNPRNDIINGHGVWRSTDTGQSWHFAGLPDAGQIPDIVVSPNDPDVAYVAALGKLWQPNSERGVFKTTDGGKSWKRVLFVNDSVGAADVAMVPGNPKVLFAAMWQVQRLPWEFVSGGAGSGIYRSTDGGETWKELSDGLPKGPIGRISLGIAPSNPDHVYAEVSSREGALYESLDMGDHWHKVTESRAVAVRPWYFAKVLVAPDDEEHVYFASFQLMESKDGGKTLHAVDPELHPDHHDLWLDPTNPDRMIQGQDGGVYVTQDGGESWRFLNNLPIEQFYMAALDTRTPYHICGGLQDNSGWCGPSQTPESRQVAQSQWLALTGGDGQYIVPAPSDSSIVYMDSQNGYITRLDLNTGVSRFIRPYLRDVGDTPPAELKYRFNWTSPIAVSPTDANEVYIGANVLFKSVDGGLHWQAISPDLTKNDKSKQVISGGPVFHDISGAETYNTILAITLAPSDPRVIWVGTDDGNLQVTRDGGQTWTNVRPMMPKLPPEGRFYQVGVSPYDPGTVYVALDRHMFADNHPYVLKGTDYGRHWTRIDAGLPDDQAAHVVRESPFQRGFLVLGTDRGLYYSQDAGAHWSSLQDAFPAAAVYDLKFAPQSHGLVAATHGRGLFVLDDLAPLEQLTDGMKAQKLAVIAPHPTINYYGGSPVPEEPTVFQAPNPPRGMPVYYWLSEKPDSAGARRPGSGPVTVTILDARGDTVASDHDSGKKGLNRYVWNLRYDGPTQLAFGREGGRGGGRRGFGPAVLPGSYTVVVSAAGQSERVQGQVLADPRIPYDPQAGQAQLAAAQQLVGEMDALNTMLNRLHQMREQLKQVESLYGKEGVQPDSGTAAHARALEKKLGALMDTLYNPKVQRGVIQDDIHFLGDFQGALQGLGYGLFFPYDQAPNELQIENMQRVSQELNQYLARYDQLVATDVAAYNQYARQHGAPVVVSGGAVTVKAGPTTDD